MKVSGGMAVVAVAAAVAVMVALVAVPEPVGAYVTSFPEEPDIDGILLTVGIAVAHWLAGLLPYPGVSALINAIIEAWTPKPEDDYWTHVEEQVQEVCGEFINQDNINKVLMYKDDLISLLEIYDAAPVTSDGSYPDKNVQADAITTSIISNRFLFEAAEQPWSMTLYFVDIASAHILILKDVAETYTTAGGQTSLWWKDLSRELQHYSDYARTLYTETVAFRKENIECYFDEGGSLDEYVMTDHVTGVSERCTQVHPDGGAVGSCSKACQNFETQMLRTVNRWYQDRVGVPVQEWEALKALALQLSEVAQEQMAGA